MSRAITVAVLSPVTGGFYFGEILAGVTREIAAAGGTVILLQTLDAGHSRDELVSAPEFVTPAAWSHIDGVVSITTGAPRLYLEQLRAAGKAVVLASDNVSGFAAPSASPDNFGGVRAAVDHLIGHGHVRIGFAGNLVQSDMRERYEAYREGLLAHGIEPDPAWFFPASDNSELGGAGVAQALVDAEVPVSALVVATDRNAIGLLESLADAGVSVPRDLAVVGFDDIERGSFTAPTLASVSQHFDEVGALAGRLVLAQLRGEDVGDQPHTWPSVFVPRESCGCSGALLPARTDAATEAAIGRAIAALTASIGEAWRTGEELSTTRLKEAVALVQVLEPRPEALRQIVRAITDHLGGLAATDREHSPEVRLALARYAAEVSGALWQTQAKTYLERSIGRERSLREQYDIGLELLDHDRAEPQRLTWLSATQVRMGCLALWDEDPSSGRLRVAGVYDPAGALPNLIGTTMSVEEFPPAELLAHARTGEDEVTFVIPVRARGVDWGLLAVIGQIDTTSSSGRESYNQWAALLAASFEQEALLESVRSSEERYSLVALATNDGLWDWDLRSNRVYYSDRCLELLGQRASGRHAEPSLWFDAVHADDLATLRAKLAAAVTSEREPIEVEHRVRSADGEYRFVSCRALPVGPDGAPAQRIVGSLADIQPRKQLEEQLRQGALYDEVTGLPNRKLFLERLTFAIAQARRSHQLRYAVVFLDLDGFKLVNDSLGHLVGDRLLTKVGERLRHGLREVDTVARFGGDEFAVLLHDIEPAAMHPTVERMQRLLAAPMELDGHDVVVTASVGIATSDGGYTSADDVLRDADAAMYHAKARQRGTCALFDIDMHTGAVNRLGLQSELRQALERTEFEVHYQPIVDLNVGAATDRFEALVRWRHPERGLVPPMDFLPVMEETGLILPLGRWIFEEVCRQIAEWQESYDGTVNVSVNVSHREFWDPGLLSHVLSCLARHGLEPGNLTIEITESVVMRKPDVARKVMQQLHAAGLSLHIDDFGTGNSSLHALHRFPVQALKIDRSFISELDVDSRTTELVQIIVAMGRALGIDVVAEGVETEAQLDHLREMGCGNAQGFWFTKAVDGATAAGFLGHSLPSHDLRDVSAPVPIHGARARTGLLAARSEDLEPVAAAMAS